MHMIPPYSPKPNLNPNPNPVLTKDLPLEYAFAFEQVDLGQEAQEVALGAKSVTAYKVMRMSPGGFALHGEVFDSWDRTLTLTLTLTLTP